MYGSYTGKKSTLACFVLGCYALQWINLVYKFVLAVFALKKSIHSYQPYD